MIISVLRQGANEVYKYVKFKHRTQKNISHHAKSSTNQLAWWPAVIFLLNMESFEFMEMLLLLFLLFNILEYEQISVVHSPIDEHNRRKLAA